MSELTGKTGADVAWARPADIPADVILNYSGPAFAGLEQIRAWGKPYLLGFESTTTRAYAGYDAGVVDAQQLRGVAATIPGYLESSCGAWYCAADERSTPAWALGGITDYGRAFRDVFGPTVPLIGYGNPDARRAAAAGSGAPFLPWGIGTWGEGEGGYPNQPPASSECALVQSGNTAGPAPGTDLNWLYQPLELFRAYGGPAGAPPSSSTSDRGVADMECLVGPKYPSGHLAVLVDSAGEEIARFGSSGAGDEAYGLPLAISRLPVGTPVRVFNDVELWAKTLKVHDARQQRIKAGG